MDEKIIYLDNAATTRVCKSAADASISAMENFYGNPSSVHTFGYEAQKELEKSRKTLLHAIGSSERGDDFIFTSGGTESNNLAIFGAVSAQNKHCGNTILVGDSEHASVYNISKRLSELGYDIKYIPSKNGKLDLDFCENVLKNQKVILMSCMYVNNETGAVYDVKSLDALRKTFSKNTVFHVDGVQAFMKTKEKLIKTGADLISVSGHKIHAPKGVGGLYIKSGTKISNIIYGGGQEQNIRSGTEPMPGICAFAAAAEEYMNDSEKIHAHIEELYKYAKEKISGMMPDIAILSPENFSPYVMSISVPNIRSEIMLRFLSEKNIFVSAGSACSAKHRENRVLINYGLDFKSADSTLRISFSKYNTKEDIDSLSEALYSGKNSLIKVKYFS